MCLCVISSMLYGRPISTVIILVKNTSTLWVRVGVSSGCRCVLCAGLFDHAIIFDCIWPFEHIFLCPQTHSHTRILLCNDTFLFVCWFRNSFTQFSSVWVSVSVWFHVSFSKQKRFCRFLQLKINEQLDYRICGQSSSQNSRHIVIVFGLVVGCSMRLRAWNWILLQYASVLCACVTSNRPRIVFCHFSHLVLVVVVLFDYSMNCFFFSHGMHVQFGHISHMVKL